MTKRRSLIAILGITLLVLTAGALVAGDTPQTKPAGEAGKAAAPAAAAAAPAKANLRDPGSLNAKAPATFKARFETSKGNVVIEVNREWAPLGADRFYNLVKGGYFENVRFFRVVPGFVVQFGIHGDPAISSAWKAANLKDDPVKESNKRGYLTYAKSSAPNSRTTQIFINLKDNASLDGQGFAPFAKVVEGMEVVDAFNSKYGESLTSLQGQIYQEGNLFLATRAPDLDYIKKASILP